jgi:hypothetical protein
LKEELFVEHTIDKNKNEKNNTKAGWSNEGKLWAIEQLDQLQNLERRRTIEENIEEIFMKESLNGKEKSRIFYNSDREHTGSLSGTDTTIRRIYTFITNNNLEGRFEIRKTIADKDESKIPTLQELRTPMEVIEELE